MPGEYTFNSGSKLFTPLADYLDLGVDKVNFVLCMVACLPISIWFYHCCGLGKVSRRTRLVLPPAIGLILCHFMYGHAFKHVIALALGCYAALRLSPLNHIHRVVFAFSAAYLTWMHWYRAWYMTYYAIDISGLVSSYFCPMMLLVQRATMLAFNVHDGVWKEKRGEKLTDYQRSEAVRRMPSLLEYVSYMLNYQGIFCGPLVFYVDYLNWIDEKHVYAKNAKPAVASSQPNPPSNGVSHCGPSGDDKLPAVPWHSVLQKVCLAIAMISVVVFFESYFPLSSLTTIDERGVVSWFVRMHCALLICRCQYYFAWYFSDAVHNACGLGFSGYHPVTGEPQWDLISNIKIVPVEFGNSWKQLVDNWNMSTVRWLRRISFDRTRPDLRTFCTFLLSAWWHGFFPAYYVLFLQGGLLTAASRRVRKSFRHRLLPLLGQLGYDVLTTVLTRVFIVYVCFPWVYIWIPVPITIYTQMYFIGHILLLLAIGVLPLVLTPEPVNEKLKPTILGVPIEKDDDSNDSKATDDLDDLKPSSVQTSNHVVKSNGHTKTQAPINGRLDHVNNNHAKRE